MVFKPDLGVNGVRWGRSVYALGGNAVRDVCKEQIKSVIDCALSSRPDDQTHWGEKKGGGGFIFEPCAENALMWMEIKSELGEWM